MNRLDVSCRQRKRSTNHIFHEKKNLRRKFIFNDFDLLTLSALFPEDSVIFTKSFVMSNKKTFPSVIKIEMLKVTNFSQEKIEFSTKAGRTRDLPQSLLFIVIW